MPKMVDAEARRHDVVAALFRVVIREGLQHASLRNVTEEAGLNIGSLRHYFTSHQELTLFAMRSMLDRVSERLHRRIEAAPSVDRLTQANGWSLVAGLLEELLPLDDVRRAEVTVWVEFITAARTDPSLAALARESAAATRTLISTLLGRIAEAGDLEHDLDVDSETERLASLVDGLSLNAILYPDRLSANDCLAALHAHLHKLQAAADQTSTPVEPLAPTSDSSAGAMATASSR